MRKLILLSTMLMVLCISVIAGVESEENIEEVEEPIEESAEEKIEE